MDKYNIGQVLTIKEDIELEKALSGNTTKIKAGTKRYVGADGYAHYLNEMLQLLGKGVKPEGYSVEGIADWLYMWISRQLPLDEFLNDYEVSKEEFKEHISDALEELGMWDSTGNRS